MTAVLEAPAKTGAPRTALAAVLLTGLVGAAVLVPKRPGLGWLLTGVAVAGTAIVTAWASGRRRPAPGQFLWGAAALALLAVGAFRAAGWIYAYCVLGALLAGSLAVAGGRTVPGLARGMAAGAVAGVRGLPWAARGLAAVRRRRHGGPRLGLSVLVAAALLLVFGALLASADEAFRAVVTALSPDLDGMDTAREVFGFLTGTAVALGTAFLAANRPGYDGIDPLPPGRPVRRIEWVVPLAALDALFLVFAVVQLTVLAGGHWAGTDYARYTRQGFFQLVAVTVLTLIVLGLVVWVAPRQERTDRILLRVLLGALAGLALVIVASALLRLGRYEQAYGWTRLRVLVGAVEVWLGLLFVLVLAAGIRLRAGWLPRAVAGTAVAGLLAVALVSPDRFIADRNVDRFARTGDIDLSYLATLSADAVPALDRLPEDYRSCALWRIAVDMGESDGWRTWNLGRAQARAILARHEVHCQTY
jgi:hypothetical protein